MDFKTFLEHFDTIADAPNGIPKLRSLILDLAVRGKLIPQYSHEISAVKLLKDIDEQRKKLIKAQVIRSRNAEPIEQAYEPYTTPTSWKWVRLCEVTHDLGQKKPDVTFSYIDVSAIDQEQGSVSSNVSILNPEDAPSRARKLVKKGTVIYSTVRPYLLNIAVINQEYEPESIVSTAFSVLHPFDGVSNWYLYYLLRSQYFTDYVERYQKGVAYPAISDTDLLQAPIPLPPFEEQIRIVEKVDELMTLCDRLQAAKQTRDTRRQKLRGSAIDSLMNAETDEALQKGWAIVRDNWVELSQSPEDVGDLRRSVLQLAVRGKLVPQNPNDEPVEILIKDIKTEKDRLIEGGKIKKSKLAPQIEKDAIPYELPQYWKWIVLDNICSKITDGVHATPKYTSSGIPFLSVTQLKNEQLDFSSAKYISKEQHDLFYQRCDPKKGDVLICKVGGTIGVTAVIEAEIEFSIFVQLALLKPIFVNPYYLKYVLLSGWVQKYIQDNSAGSAMPYISIGKLKAIMFPLPPLVEQKRIVAKVDELMQMCDRLEESLRQSQQWAEALAASAINHLTI